MITQDIKPIACCFIGHNTIRKKDLSSINAITEEHIIMLYEKGYRYFLAGGDLGYHTIAALTVMKLKKQLLDIKLVLVLPSGFQSDSWNNNDIAMFEMTKACADEIIFTSHFRLWGYMKKRSRFLVNSSSACITYQYKKSDPIVTYALEYAKKSDIEIFI